MRKIILISLIAFLVLFIYTVNSFADEGQFTLEKDLKYTIILELNQNFSYKIKDVYVTGTVEIDKKSFLSVRVQGLVKESTALLALDSIRAIIPQINIQEELIQQPKSK